jgi:flagellar hook-associated protein 2
MSSVGLSSSNLSSLLGSSTSSSSNGIDLSSLLEVATGSSSEGIDVTSAVNAAITAARAPETQWQAQQATLQSEGNDLTTVEGQVTTLENDLSALNSLSGAFSTLSTASSNSNIATATTTPGAVAGTHVVNVTNLATTSSWYSTTPVASGGLLSAGTFNLQVGSGSNSTRAQITVTNNETLTQLASAINGNSSVGSLVTASVVTDANGSRLSIISNSSGSANNISITSPTQQLTQAADGSAWNSASVLDGTNSPGLSAETLALQVGTGAAAQISITNGESLSALANSINGQNLGITANVIADSNGTSSHLQIVNNTTGNASGMTISDTQFTQATLGVNATLTVDGIPNSSPSNIVTGAVPGVTFNLGGTGTGATVSITPNTQGITSAINQFVADYNTVIGTVNSEYTYNSTNSTAAPLAGDSALAMLQNALLGAGSYSSSGAISTLGALGISMNDDGTLSVDSSTLNDAVQNNASAVQNFFEGTSLNGFSNALNTQLQSLTAPNTGAFSVDLTSMKNNYNDLEDQINNFEDNYISSLQTNLTAEYDAAEIALQQVNTTKEQINAELGNNSSGN